MTRYTFPFLLLCLSSNFVLSQYPGEVWIKGKVIDHENGKPVPYAQVASYSLVSVFAADSAGVFQIEVPVSDSLRVVALGYHPVLIKASDITGVITIRLERMTYMLKQVDVYRMTANENLSRVLPSDIKLGVENPIPVAMRGDAFNRRPPVIVAVINPLSFAQYHLSGKEKAKRKLRATIANEKRLSLLQRDEVERLSGYSGPKLEEFWLFCIRTIRVELYDNQVTLELKILEARSKYEQSTNDLLDKQGR